MPRGLDIVIVGLAITSSWGNGHATTYRSLVKGLARCGHRVLFLERDQPWYAAHRDATHFDFCETGLYTSVDDLCARYGSRIRQADLVIVGSFVLEGALVCDRVLEIARGVRAFYDIDTPVTLSSLERGDCPYLRTDQVAAFDLFLSFTGGPTLDRLEQEYGASRAVPLYCSVDVDSYRPRDTRADVALGYMGTYSVDRQPGVETLLNEPARRLPDASFLVAGAQYPGDVPWPPNVRRVDHLAPADHAAFYNSQRFTLNVTRADMRRSGHAPSVRLFEAAACGVPIISDEWPGLGDVLRIGEEIIVARTTDDVVLVLAGMPDVQRMRIAEAARERALCSHSGEQRALELVGYLDEQGPRTLRAS